MLAILVFVCWFLKETHVFDFDVGGPRIIEIKVKPLTERERSRATAVVCHDEVQAVLLSNYYPILSDNLVGITGS